MNAATRLLLTTFFVIFGLGYSSADAGDWMYRRSYFSHHPQQVQDANGQPVPQAAPFPSRTAYRPALVGGRPGFVVRGGSRINAIRIWNGDSFDTTILEEDWVERFP